jgi:hypothetical protein
MSFEELCAIPVEGPIEPPEMDPEGMFLVQDPSEPSHPQCLGPGLLGWRG